VTDRLKTLWFAAKRDADVVDATLSALDSITVYAKNNSRTFRGALVWVGFQDIVTVTGGTIGEHRVACSVNGAGATTITELDDIANSGEQLGGVIGPFDFTSHFTTNFPAADSASCVISVYFDQTTGTTLGMRNVNALLALTYQYDDNGVTTDFHTDICPIESPVAGLPTTETELGTNQIPQFTGAGGDFENVASLTERQRFFLVEGNDGSGGSATDYVLNLRVDSLTTKTFAATEKALASDCYQQFIHIQAGIDLTAVHAFKAWTTGAGRLNMAVCTMFTTFEYTVSGTTAFTQSAIYALEMPSPMGGTAAGDASRFQRTIPVPEPATVTLKQSAVRLYFVEGATALAGLNVRVGAQAYRTYTPNASVVCGCSCMQQRVDSGGAQGAGIASFARGQNTFTLDVYRTDATDLGWNLSGILILRYRSGVAANGVPSHTHTVIWPVMQWDALLGNLRTQAGVAPIIPETSYWLSAIGFWMTHWDAASANGIEWQAENQSGEGPAAGWRDLYADVQIKDAERACIMVWCRARDDFQRHSTDPDTDRMAVETSRDYRYVNVATCAKGVVMFLTYHSITFTLSGTISGSAGGTVNIYVKKATDPIRGALYKTSRVGNGAYSVSVYDDVPDYAVDAFEDDTHVGASAEAVV